MSLSWLPMLRGISPTILLVISYLLCWESRDSKWRPVCFLVAERMIGRTPRPLKRESAASVCLPSSEVPGHRDRCTWTRIQSRLLYQWGIVWFGLRSHEHWLQIASRTVADGLIWRASRAHVSVLICVKVEVHTLAAVLSISVEEDSNRPRPLPRTPRKAG